MTTTDVHESYTYAREAEHAVSHLADVISPDTGKADYDNRTLALGLSGIINALLAINDTIGAASDDLSSAVAESAELVSGAVDAAFEAPRRPRPWWRPASWADRQAYERARVALATLPVDVGDAEFEAANHAVIVAGSRLPWWQR